MDTLGCLWPVPEKWTQAPDELGKLCVALLLLFFPTRTYFCVLLDFMEFEKCW